MLVSPPAASAPTGVRAMGVEGAPGGGGAGGGGGRGGGGGGGGGGGRCHTKLPEHFIFK